jgi:hypothetical protein
MARPQCDTPLVSCKDWIAKPVYVCLFDHTINYFYIYIPILGKVDLVKPPSPMSHVIWGKKKQKKQKQK